MMQYTLNELWNRVFADVLEVYDVFKNHFGEDFVDLQDGISREDFQSFLSVRDILPDDGSIYHFAEEESVLNLRPYFADCYFHILVWWPNVTVTNENNKSVSIQDLYAKIPLSVDGGIPMECDGFLLNRSRYSLEQFYSDYMHSHVSRIPKSDLTEFQRPCLGTGPIIGTINALKTQPDIPCWMLFCEELSRYVTVESLTGHPYKYLERIGIGEQASGYVDFQNYSSYMLERLRQESHGFIDTSLLKTFALFYLSHGHLSLGFTNGRFVCGLSYYDYMIDVSNAFIDFYNQEFAMHFSSPDALFRSGALVHLTVANGKFQLLGRDCIYDNYRQYIGRYVCTFKGRRVTLQIDDSPTFEAELSTVLDCNIAMYILQNILKIINFRYENKHHSNTASDKAATFTPATCQRAVYI